MSYIFNMCVSEFDSLRETFIDGITIRFKRAGRIGAIALTNIYIKEDSSVSGWIQSDQPWYGKTTGEDTLKAIAHYVKLDIGKYKQRKVLDN